MAEPRALFPDATVKVDAIPPDGRDVSIKADGEQRAELTELVHVTSVDAFAADLLVQKVRGGLRVTGRLTARVTQPCVVTLEPVSQDIDEPVDRVFMPGQDAGADAAPGSEVFVDLESDDIPDNFQGPDLDLTPLLIEIFGLAIDLYPRSPEAGPALDHIESDNRTDGPFAALARLRSEDEGNK